MDSLASDVLSGRAAAVARAISIAGNSGAAAQRLRAALKSAPERSPEKSAAHRIGITGPPGAGKSTLIGGLVRLLRSRGEKVGVVACDPASPVTGGAFLGDRMRMLEACGDDPEVFIRSLAARGPGADLPDAAIAAAEVLEAAGFGRIIIETPGSGQCDTGLGEAADTVVVVLAPDAGDEFQTMKAGILETADVLVVNRADRPGCEFLVRALEQEVAARARANETEVISTIATRGEGLDVLLAAIERHRDRSKSEAGA